MEKPWTIADANELYGIDAWGKEFFDLSPEGEMRVRMRNGKGNPLVSLKGITDDLKSRGIDLPVILRFPDILDDRIQLINESFSSAIQKAGYNNHYRGVFPIKVNQQQQVIEEVVEFGERYHHGLEAGSKPELLAALTYLQDPEAYIICNGYKDAEFIDLALMGCKMGLAVMLVAEMPSEVDLILERADIMGIKPRIGLRAKLSAPGDGYWIESAGDRSVFGLNAGQILTITQKLETAGRLDCLELLHFHLGSQIPNIRNIRTAIEEAARLYSGLLKMGAKMGHLDIGGGLAVDYDGSQSASTNSRNYGIREYCEDIIEELMRIFEEEETPHPILISESGRFTVAHYAILVFNILDVASVGAEARLDSISENSHNYVVNLYEMNDTLNAENLQECFNDALFYRDQIRSMFLHGVVTLEERGQAEQIFNHLLGRISAMLEELDEIPEALEALHRDQADIYYGNFSLFQSLPDAWAIDQIFPVVPIHRLNEKPTRRGVIADITCDCDGKIDNFIGPDGCENTLPLHTLKDGEDYTLGTFIVGAYQETLGDLHNLFGDTNVVSARLDEDGQLDYNHEIEGDSVAAVLSYVEFEPAAMRSKFRRHVEAAVRANKITAQERKDFLDAYDIGMRGYTYFEHHS